MPSKKPFGMVLATRYLEKVFFKDVSNEITTFDASKAAKKGSKDKQKAARKQFNFTLRPACKTCGPDSVASGTEAAQGRLGRGRATGTRGGLRKSVFFN